MPPKNYSPRRDGVALATALFMIVVIGTIISAVVFTSSQEQRSASSQIYAERALTAAEYGQNAVLIDWDRERAWRMANGDTLRRVYNVAGGGVATAVVTKLNMTTFLVASEGEAGATRQTRARRRTSVLLPLNIPQLRVPAAFTGRGADSVGGSSITNGTDVTLDNLTPIARVVGDRGRSPGAARRRPWPDRSRPGSRPPPPCTRRTG